MILNAKNKLICLFSLAYVILLQLPYIKEYLIEFLHVQNH